MNLLFMILHSVSPSNILTTGKQGMETTILGANISLPTIVAILV